MKPTPSLLAALSVFTASACFAQSTGTVPALDIDLAAPAKPVSPTLHGLMTEEINFSYEGGLYGELLRNRSFRDDPKKAEHWTLVKDAGAEADFTVTDRKPLTDKLPNSMEVTIRKAGPQQRVSIANEGFWGIPVRPGTAYRASFYVRGAAEEKNRKKEVVTHRFSGPLHVSLVSDDGKVLAQADTPTVDDHWRNFELTLTTGADVQPSAKNKFVISAQDTGTVWFSLVSLFPPTYKNRANGNRSDIMELLAGMKPTFLRFPGGNYVEGRTLWERFNWKETRGPLPFRPGHRSCWGYFSTDGMGLLEFMGWCEDLNMQPLLAVFAGYSLDQQNVEPGPLLEPYVQEALDQIEYLTADAKTSFWGALRASDGHPAPFVLKYIEIGNEDYFDHSGSYDARYAQFSDAIKATHPNLQLIATAPVKSRRPDLIDDHYYRSAKAFFSDIHHYDNADRNGPKIFVGEWATREGSPTPNFNAALGDAAWMTGMERNSDLILMHCYAPLFVNVNPGGMQWASDLIGYDTLNSYGSPSYYAQVMFSNNIGDVLPPSKLNADPNLLLPYSVTFDTKAHMVHLKVVNPGATEQPLNVALKNVNRLVTENETITLSATSTTDTNTIQEPKKIVPVKAIVKGLSPSFSYTFKPYSITVLNLRTE